MLPGGEPFLEQTTEQRGTAHFANSHPKYHPHQRRVIEKMRNTPLVIEKIVNGGYGLGRIEDGRVILVHHTLPRETVRWKELQSHKGYSEATVTEILEASPQRLVPPCPHYGACGGCNLQHCSYAEQLRIKKGILVDLLHRNPNTALRQAVTLIADPLPSPLPLGYRQRLRLQIDENIRPGFHRFHSHACVPLTSCLLARDELNQAFQQLTGHPALRQLLAITTEMELLLNPITARVIAVHHLSRRPRPADLKVAQTIVADLFNFEEITLCGQGFLPIHTSAHPEKEAPGTLSLTLPAFPGHTGGPITLTWETGGFSQVNLEQNVRLIQTVLDFCQPGPQTSVLELFCGMGNFSIPLAQSAASLLGIEGQGASIRSARDNSTRAGLTNTCFEKSPIDQRCLSLCEEGRSFDCVVIDPPRQGAPGLASQLAALSRQRLVYISCDPATLCRDLGELINAGFILRQLQPVDMFPQTHHIETVALLEKE